MIGTTKVQAKAWYTSRTIWYNGLVFIAAVVSAALTLLGDPQSGGAVGVGAVSALTMADKAINLLLRLFTSKPVSTKAEPVYVTN